MNNYQIPPEILEQMFKDRLIRKEITSKNFWFFILFYFGHYITYPPAPFHHEIFSLLQDQSVEFLVIQAFRGSGKTTLINQFYPIWAILGEQKKKHIVILGQTLVQAKQHLRNIKAELETNELLKNDLGPFEEDDEWNSYSLVIPEHNARITAASAEQSIRGIKHGPYRPDLIILDDVEDINSVKTKESRDNIYRWVTGDVIPLGDKNTRIMIIGNLLHEDSLLMRLIKEIDQGQRTGTYRRYPLLDENNNITWPGKYPSMVDIEKEKMRVGNEIAWLREYLLILVADEDQIIKPSMIKYYEELPSIADPENAYRYTIVSVDPAISEGEKADYTAIVCARIYGYGDTMKIYVLPTVINERMGFTKTIEKIKYLSDTISPDDTRASIIVEKVNFQRAYEDVLRNSLYAAEGIAVSKDKRFRLQITTPVFDYGKILFPKQGADVLRQQLLNFGVGHDDLVDALSMLINYVVKENNEVPHLTGPDDPNEEQGFIGGGLRFKQF
jgi:predicted phage terminase large subunit-like protein